MKEAYIPAAQQPQEVTADLKGERQAALVAFSIKFSFLNLLLVSLLGLALRSFPFLSHAPLDFKNLLHGHSHFAFGGWVMPILLALLLKTFPTLTRKVAYKHWRNITVLLFISAYGMLFSFPVQGYKAVSITFSTLSIAAGYYLIVVLWKALRTEPSRTSTRLLQAGLFYLGLSAIGPFATGPLIAMGYQGTPLYFDAIYFYLHFQYNGWFTFAVLAMLYKQLEQTGSATNGSAVFCLFNLACIPAYALSLLWNQPSLVFNLVGGAAALLQAIGTFYLLRDLPVREWKRTWTGHLFLIAISALVLKVSLQVASAFPQVAMLGYLYRNFIIAYLHLALLGFISVYAFASVCAHYHAATSVFKTGFTIFFFAFLTTELLLVANACSILFAFTNPHYATWLLFFSCFFPAGILVMIMGILKSLPTSSVQSAFKKTAVA